MSSGLLALLLLLPFLVVIEEDVDDDDDDDANGDGDVDDRFWTSFDSSVHRSISCSASNLALKYLASVSIVYV